jgi:hypothetical protein
MPTTIEPNTFHERKNELRKEYLVQLDKVIQAYPSYKADLPNDYDKQISLLNGMLKKTDKLHTEITEKIKIFERKINFDDEEIEKLKKVNGNLQKYTSFEDLDATSKRMLSDSIEEYNTKRLLFWIKFSIILIIVIKCVKEYETRELGIIIGATFVIGSSYILYKKYTSKG